MRKSFDEALIESATRMGPRYACLMENAPGSKSQTILPAYSAGWKKKSAKQNIFNTCVLQHIICLDSLIQRKG